MLVVLEQLLSIMAALSYSREVRIGLKTDATEHSPMPRRSETCPNCGHSFSYNEATGTGPSEFMSEGQCPNCGHHIRTPPGT